MLYPKLRLKSMASRGYTYHFHYADPEPNADRQNLELQTDGSTIWRSWVDGPSYSEKENLTALGTGFRCLQVHIIPMTKSPVHSRKPMTTNSTSPVSPASTPLRQQPSRLLISGNKRDRSWSFSVWLIHSVLHFSLMVMQSTTWVHTSTLILNHSGK